MRQQVHFITLGVSNLARSRAFYEQGLGWTPSKRNSTDGVVFFQLTSGMVFALFPKDELAKDATISPEGTGFSGVALAHNVPHKENVAEVLAEAERAGGKILKPAQDAFWGGFSGYFADPDGYLWEVAWNPHFELTEDCRLILPE